VLAINRGDVGSPNVSVTVNLTALRFAHTAGPSTARDVWDATAAPIQIPAGATSFETTSVGGHDSAFYLVSPSSA